MSLQSDQINELMGALAKAQGEMIHASKDSSNPHFRSKYADLASVWGACRESLSKNGLSVVQSMDFAGESQILVTTLGHASGQWIKSILKLPMQKPGPQELGSCITYCRRYALAAIVGVYQDDDDAESAQKSYRQKEEPKEVISDIKEGITEKQANLLDYKLSLYPEAKKWIQSEFKIDEVYSLSKADFQVVMKVFEAKDKAALKDKII